MKTDKEFCDITHVKALRTYVTNATDFELQVLLNGLVIFGCEEILEIIKENKWKN